VDEAGSRRRGSRSSKAPTRSWSTASPERGATCPGVPELLARGAEAHGFRGEIWTCERVAQVVRKEFGVSYHPAHVSRLLEAPRQSLQKPQRLSEQRPCFRTWTSPLRSSAKLNFRFTEFSEVCAFIPSGLLRDSARQTGARTGYLRFLRRGLEVALQEYFEGVAGYLRAPSAPEKVEGVVGPG
jgi:hypothetical protein